MMKRRTLALLLMIASSVVLRPAGAGAETASTSGLLVIDAAEGRIGRKLIVRDATGARVPGKVRGLALLADGTLGAVLAVPSATGTPVAVLVAPEGLRGLSSQTVWNDGCEGAFPEGLFMEGGADAIPLGVALRTSGHFAAPDPAGIYRYEHNLPPTADGRYCLGFNFHYWHVVVAPALIVDLSAFLPPFTFVVK